MQKEHGKGETKTHSLGIQDTCSGDEWEGEISGVGKLSKVEPDSPQIVLILCASHDLKMGMLRTLEDVESLQLCILYLQMYLLMTFNHFKFSNFKSQWIS